MQKIRWAVVGTSDFALNWIAPGIQMGRNATLAAIVSRDPNRAADAAQRLAAPQHFTSIEEIDRGQVDGVFIVTPNTQHAPLAIAAAQRGLHVVVEKPMAPTVQECQAMIAAAHEHGVMLAVAHCMEWAPPLAKARQLLQDGAIGIPISASFKMSFNAPNAGAWRQNEPSEAGGGPLFDVGVHSIDALQQLLGPVVRVAAFMDHHIHHYTAEDTTTLLLRFASGVHGSAQAHFNCDQNSFEIQGSDGYMWSNHWLGRNFSGELFLQKGKRTSSFNLPACNVYVPQIEHVSEAIIKGTQPVISGERGMSNIQVIEAAIKSARTGSIISKTSTEQGAW